MKLETQCQLVEELIYYRSLVDWLGGCLNAAQVLCETRKRSFRPEITIHDLRQATNSEANPQLARHNKTTDELLSRLVSPNPTLDYAKESTFGTAPSWPYKDCRITSESIRQEQETASRREIDDK